jgi:hypothetical protein
MIVEGLLTSTDSDGTLNIAPMGPIVHGDFQSFTLRPWAGSTTFQNLLQTQRGVFHIVDSITIIAAAAIRRLTSTPDTVAAEKIEGFVLDDCCRWFEFNITAIDTTHERSEMTADVVHAGVRRPFRGFNRARHAIIETAILATRLHIIAREEVTSAVNFLSPAVEKTGGKEELAAFKILQDYIDNFYKEGPSA